MRHFYFRLILGIVFIGCMIYSFVTMNIPFALRLYDLQLRYHEYSVCSAVYLPRRRIFVFRLFHLEERKR